jgi:hypothetical protein
LVTFSAVILISSLEFEFTLIMQSTLTFTPEVRRRKEKKIKLKFNRMK